jgi:hypothetical protein
MTAQTARMIGFRLFLTGLTLAIYCAAFVIQAHA